MRSFLQAPVYLILCYLLLPAAGSDQSRLSSLSRIVHSAPLQKGLFESDEVLNIKLSGNIHAVLNDRDKDPTYHPLVLSYISSDSNEVSIPVQVKTRGHFRKEKANCIYPPLLINFSNKQTASTTLFDKQDHLKLVMPCRGDEYVIKEYLVYRLYNLLTPKSFRARLVKVELDDEGRKNKAPFYGILLEEEKQVASRNKMVSVKRNLMRPRDTETETFLTMAVFEYMIGNTDWSVEYQQNVKLMVSGPSAVPITVPYDFDHAGLVDAPYAKPAEELEMNDVRERRYRGYCMSDMKRFDGTLALFNRLKKDFYNIYTSCSLLDAKEIKNITKYLDEFYTTINNPKALQTAFSYPCDPNATGNVIIKGLGKD